MGILPHYGHLAHMGVLPLFAYLIVWCRPFRLEAKSEKGPRNNFMGDGMLEDVTNASSPDWPLAQINDLLPGVGFAEHLNQM